MPMVHAWYAVVAMVPDGVIKLSLLVAETCQTLLTLGYTPTCGSTIRSTFYKIQVILPTGHCILANSYPRKTSRTLVTSYVLFLVP